MKSRLTKSIAYAFPTSTHAKEMGFEHEGCYFIQYKYVDSNDLYFEPDFQVGGFEHIDANLLQSLREANGDLCLMSLNFNPEYYAEL